MENLININYGTSQFNMEWAIIYLRDNLNAIKTNIDENSDGSCVVLDAYFENEIDALRWFHQSIKTHKIAPEDISLEETYTDLYFEREEPSYRVTTFIDK